ncbi:hypothetical protein N431DRAFT_472352 [Stipitochalara longipes BDJ]|nr:hypothetical protein N431DRAFT_472352 [Stipitochalara longipes BDJ]
MSLGWSTGDVLSGVKLLVDILSSLKDANGSRTRFQELESELQGLSRAMSEIAHLADGTLKRFYEKIKPFEASLGTQSVSGKVKAAPRMVRLGLLMEKEIPELRTYLAAHVGYLNMRLSVATINALAGNRSAQKESTGMVLRQLDYQKLDIFEKINQIATESTIPKLDSLLLTANKVWKAQEDMMAILSKAMEQTPPPDIRHTWAQAPVTLEDALGRQIPVPSEYDWAMLHAVIQARFREGPGHAKVRSGEYEIFMNVDSSNPVTASTFSGLIPGMKVTMYMILGQYAGSERCPRIGCQSDTFERHKEGGSICIQCRTWFRRSSKSLPKPLKPPLGYIIMGTQDSTSSSSQTIPKPNIDLQAASSDRRCYRNVSIYITELPPTPTRFRDKYPRGYIQTSNPTQESITGLPRARVAPLTFKAPRLKPLHPLLQEQPHSPAPPLVTFTTPSQYLVDRGPRAHSFLMNPIATDVCSRSPAAISMPVIRLEQPDPERMTLCIQKDLRSRRDLPRNGKLTTIPTATQNKTAVPRNPQVPLIFSSDLWDLLRPFLKRMELLSLTRVCGRLRLAIEHYLYEDLQWMESDSNGLFQGKPRLCLLLGSVLRRPQLAGRIKHISLMVYDKAGTVDLGGSLATSDLKLAESFIKKNHLYPNNQLTDKLHQGSCDAIVALFVSLLWKLETLRVTIGMSNGQACFVGTILQLNAFRIYGLRSLDYLKTIELNANSFSTSEFHEEIATLFVLPSLDSVTLTGFRSSVFESRWAARTDSTRPRTLKIKQSCIQESDLDRLLTTLSPNVKVLEFDFYDDGNTFGEFFDCSALSRALRPVRHGLQRLTISITLQESVQLSKQHRIPRRLDDFSDYLWLQYVIYFLIRVRNVLM